MYKYIFKIINEKKKNSSGERKWVKEIKYTHLGNEIIIIFFSFSF